MFAVYIFSHFSRLSNIRQNMYNVKIYFTMPHRANNIKIVNSNPHEIAYFLKFLKNFTCENIYVHSMPR